jgi:hypothetical protein
MAKPIVISRHKNNPIIIVKPKEISISKEADEAQRIEISKEVKPIEIRIANTGQQTEETAHIEIFREKIIQQEQFSEEITLVENNTPEISKTDDETQSINTFKEEKSIGIQYTNTVQQANEEITHFKFFQEKAMLQEQFTKETTFIENNALNPNNPKQFERWQTLQLRKESHKGYEEIEAK